MADLLVKLYDIEYHDYHKKMKANGIVIKKACIIDKNTILKFVAEGFSNEAAWVNECEYALFNNSVTCYIAVKNKEVIGFACYDATARGFFGPTGVKESERHKGVGSALLVQSLHSMKEMGYAYAIIGWTTTNAKDFYKKQVGAVEIADSPPNKSIYKNMVSSE